MARYPSSLISQSHSNRSEEHTSELQSQSNLVCRLLLEKKIVLVLPANWIMPISRVLVNSTCACVDTVVLAVVRPDIPRPVANHGLRSHLSAVHALSRVL